MPLPESAALAVAEANINRARAKRNRESGVLELFIHDLPGGKVAGDSSGDSPCEDRMGTI
jgi:hypothetical protein